MCPSQCLCKGHAVYCAHSDVDIYSLPTNMTLLYLPYTTSSANSSDDQLSNFKDLGLLNMSNSRLATNVIRDFLLYLPKLRVLLMRNASIGDLSSKFFIHLPMLNILDLKENVISILTTGCFTGLVNIASLDLHNMNIETIQSKCFDGMKSLQLLNLSSNQLEFLDYDIFQSLTMLINVDLRGNAFKEIDISAFQNVYILMHVSTMQLCCYVEAPSICINDDFRYLPITTIMLYTSYTMVT